MLLPTYAINRHNSLMPGLRRPVQHLASRSVSSEYDVHCTSCCEVMHGMHKAEAAMLVGSML